MNEKLRKSPEFFIRAKESTSIMYNKVGSHNKELNHENS